MVDRLPYDQRKFIAEIMVRGLQHRFDTCECRRLANDTVDGVGKTDKNELADHYLAEIKCCLPLFDPQHLLQKLKRSVEIYPAALQQKMILNCLTTAEFTLSHAHGFADRGDLLNTIGCLTKIAFVLLQSLFALNVEYYFGDKGSLEAVDRFPIQPSFFRPAPGITGDADANTARPQIRQAADSDAMVGDRRPR